MNANNECEAGMINLKLIKNSNPRLLDAMRSHYSKPLGFVGRNIHYTIIHNDNVYGYISGGSATLHLAGRKEFMKEHKFNCSLEEIINNIFYHVDGPYPIRNFTTEVVARFRDQISFDWAVKYGDNVMMFETLVELPRTGELYKRDKWKLIGQTKGFTCKRTKGKDFDSYSGRRIWNTKDLRPKLVFARLP